MSSYNALNAANIDAKGSALDYVAENNIDSLRVICNLALKKHYNLEEVDAYGNTALLKACYLGRYEAVQTLLQFNANIKATNYFGQNALTLATNSGNLQLIKTLLRHRSYENFNEASIVPAHCVAQLNQNKQLINYFKNLEKNDDESTIVETVHGLSSEDLEQMTKQDEINSAKSPENLFV